MFIYTFINGEEMQLYNLNTLETMNILVENIYNPFANIDIFLYKNILVNAYKLKNKVVVELAKIVMYTTLFIFLAGGLLLKGVSVINGEIHFEPNLVILPTIHALLGTIGFYIMIELIKYAFDNK